MAEHSLKKRYIFKFITNLGSFIISIVTASIIPRGLGPKLYGDFNFLTNFFSKLLPFFTLSTDMAYYTKISCRQDEYKIVGFYSLFTTISITNLFLFIIVSYFTKLSNIIWINQNIKYVIMAGLYSSIFWIIELMTKTIDAFGLTVYSEIARLIQKFISLIIISILFISLNLNLETYYLQHYFTLILLGLSFIAIIKIKSTHKINWNLTRDQVFNYLKEFFEYSTPLFILNSVIVFTDIIDRYLLQLFGGSIQQGFFSLSYKISTICFIFTSAIATLIIREMSLAHMNNNVKEIARLFRKFVPTLYSISALFGCFASVQASKISIILGGDQYSSAYLPIMIMSLYPIHQTYGQLIGAVLFATGETKKYRNVNIIFALIGLPIAFFVLAPKSVGGINAGSVGLACKIVILQLFSVNVLFYYVSNLIKINFKKYIAHQILCFITCISTALFSKYLTDKIILNNGNIIMGFLISGIIYILISISILIIQPKYFGLKHDDVLKILKLFKKLTGIGLA